jgi:hypothetical protein
MTKPKATKTRPKSDGRQALKATKTQPESNGRHEHKAVKAPSKSLDSKKKQMIANQVSKSAVEHHEAKHEKFHGVLQDFNLSPKGGIEGFVLHSDGKTVQVNVTPDVGFAVVRGIGQHVEATVESHTGADKHGHGNHPVYSLVSLTGTDGKALISSGGSADTVSVQGVVKRINYAQNGAANGVILEDSGDFIHLSAEGMKRIGLKAGDQVTAEGTAALMPLGQRVIEAKIVNGVAVKLKKPTPAGSHRVR